MRQTIESKKRKPRNPLTLTQQELAVQFLPMARNMAKPLKKQHPHYWEEFESAACMALVEAAESFDPGRQVKFSTFASTRIRGALLDVKRSRKARYRNPDRTGPADYMPIEHDPKQHARVLIASQEPEIGSDLESIEVVENWLSKLPKNHAAACRQIYLHGKTHVQASEALGLSASRISSLHLEAIQMLNGSYPQKTRTRTTDAMVAN